MMIPHILRMKQQREPTGPHRQNTTFPATSPALPISASGSSRYDRRMRNPEQVVEVTRTRTHMYNPTNDPFQTKILKESKFC